MNRFTRNRSYKTVKAKDPTDPKWAGRYITQNFEFSHLTSTLGVDVEMLTATAASVMRARQYDARKAFLMTLDDALGELLRMKFRAQHDPDLTDYDDSHYDEPQAVEPKTFSRVNLAIFPDGCLMKRVDDGNTGPACGVTKDGIIKHHPNCPIEPTEQDDPVCSECESAATVHCERCDSPCCDFCFVHYHFLGKRHEIG